MYQEDSFKTSQVVYAHTRSDEADMEDVYKRQGGF